MIKLRKPNQNGEFLIVVQNTIEKPDVYQIYDITQFFPSVDSSVRTKYINEVKHKITGENNTIYIINAGNTLSEKDAIRLAVAWFTGETI